MRYIFQVHVSKNCTVADHCRNYALSSPNDKDYQTICDHSHDDNCDRCQDLSSVIQEIEQGLDQAAFSKDAKEELTFVISTAKSNINAWKAHLMRSVNQDECRLEILKTLDTKSVFLVLDWAMKYLPRKFRESQTDWFGKRGIPWHITVAFRRAHNGDMQIQTFVHLFESSNQDNCDVLAILDDVFRQLKSTNPELERVHLRQDNASCYHNALTIFAAYQAAKKNNLHLKSMDFSDPQGGKGSCHRKAATIKSHMAVYLNSGNDIDTPAQTKEAMESFGGIPGLNINLCGPTNSKGRTNLKWPGVSLINNIQFSKGLKVWKAYNIGPGKSIPWKSLDVPRQENLPCIVPITQDGNAVESKSGFVTVKPRKSAKSSSSSKKEDQQENENVEEHPPDQLLFTCPEEGCVKSYQRYSGLQKHLDCGNHRRTLENETLYDLAILGYATRLESCEASAPQIKSSQLSRPSSGSLAKAMGWALKSTSGRKRFSEKQKEYLKAIFDIGQKSGRKANPINVEKEMRQAKDSNGARLFESHEFLTSKQITSFFSRLAAKRNVDIDEESGDEESGSKEEVENERQSALHEMKDTVMSDVSLQCSHPIVYESYNLCEMVEKSKLNTFSIAMLKNICTDFGLDISHIKGTRKKPYQELLNNLVKECECQKPTRTLSNKCLT